MDSAIQHDPTGHRFTTVVEGVTGLLEYEVSGRVMAITHTVVPPAIGGRGIAGSLVKAALDHARAEGWKVTAPCSYADTWMRRHPVYEDMRA